MKLVAFFHQMIFFIACIHRFLAVHLKKQLFRTLALENIQKEALKLSPSFGNHEVVFFLILHEFLIKKKQFKFA